MEARRAMQVRQGRAEQAGVGLGGLGEGSEGQDKDRAGHGCAG